MEERMLSELTRAQIEYITIHTNNLLNSYVFKNEISRADMLTEENALRRFVNIYKSKYKIDKDTNKALIRYTQTVPTINLFANNENKGEQ